MLQPFDVTVEEMKQLIEETHCPSKFAKIYSEHILPLLFEDAYLIKLKDGFYKLSYFSGDGANFFTGVSKLSPYFPDQEEYELEKIVNAYEESYKKLQTIKDYLHALEEVEDE